MGSLRGQTNEKLIQVKKKQAKNPKSIEKQFSEIIVNNFQNLGKIWLFKYGDLSNSNKCDHKRKINTVVGHRKATKILRKSV